MGCRTRTAAPGGPAHRGGHTRAARAVGGLRRAAAHARPRRSARRRGQACGLCIVLCAAPLPRYPSRRSIARPCTGTAAVDHCRPRLRQRRCRCRVGGRSGGNVSRHRDRSAPMGGAGSPLDISHDAPYRQREAGRCDANSSVETGQRHRRRVSIERAVRRGSRRHAGPIDCGQQARHPGARARTDCARDCAMVARGGGAVQRGRRPRG